MTEERQRVIAQKVWQREAVKSREAMKGVLSQAFQTWEFLAEDTTTRFGQAYWRKAETCGYEMGFSLPEAVSELGVHGHENVIWLHRNSDSAGALKVVLGELTRNAEMLREHFGPDVLFATSDLSFGLCYEDGEDGPRLRRW